MTAEQLPLPIPFGVWVALGVVAALLLWSAGVGLTLNVLWRLEWRGDDQTSEWDCGGAHIICVFLWPFMFAVVCGWLAVEWWCSPPAPVEIPLPKKGDVLQQDEVPRMAASSAHRV